jgi:hypothetical protein
VNDVRTALRKYLNARLSNLVDDSTAIEYADALAEAIIASGVARTIAEAGV